MTSVPLVRRLWGLIRATGADAATLRLSAREPSEADVAGAEGVLLLTGILKGDCLMMDLPIVGAVPFQPRCDSFTGVSGADGIAAIAFEPPFTSAPKATALAVPNLLAGPVKGEIVAGSLTKAGCKVKVTTSALATGAVAALAGAAVTVIAIGG